MAEKDSMTEMEAKGRGKDTGKSKKKEKARKKENMRAKRKSQEVEIVIENEAHKNTMGTLTEPEFL